MQWIKTSRKLTSCSVSSKPLVFSVVNFVSDAEAVWWQAFYKSWLELLKPEKNLFCRVMACYFTVFPVKPWTPEKMSGMFIVSRPIRCEMKPQKITDKPQNGLITTWHETASSLFLPRGIFNFTVFKYWNFSFSISALLSPKNRYERHFTEKGS